MQKPVLVLHGVATRGEQGFAERVAKLNQALGPAYALIPVYWGDLASDAGERVLDTLPLFDRPAEEQLDAYVQALLKIGKGTFTRRDPAATIAGAALAQAGAEEVRSAGLDSATLEATISAALADTEFLAEVEDPQLLEQVGRVIGASLGAQAGGAKTGGGTYLDSAPAGGSPYNPYGSRGEEVRSNVGAWLKRQVKELDVLLGRRMSAGAGQIINGLRLRFGAGFAMFLGDVFVYQRNRDRIHARVWERLDAAAPGFGVPGRPVDVVAHSLGGLVAFDSAVHPADPARTLHIAQLATFGSQPALFHAVDPRAPNVAPYLGDQPVTLPPTIERWTNLWDPLDPLSYATERVFKLASGSGPIDLRLVLPLSTLPKALVQGKGITHDSYWDSEGLPTLLSELLRDQSGA